MDPYFYTRKKEKKSSRNFGNKISEKMCGPELGNNQRRNWS